MPTLSSVHPEFIGDGEGREEIRIVVRGIPSLFSLVVPARRNMMQSQRRVGKVYGLWSPLLP